MKKKFERRHLAYDDFRRFVESGEWLEANNVSRELASQLAKTQVAQASESIRTSRIYFLDAEVCRTLIGLVNKAGETRVPLPSFPILPMWIEFGVFIGDDAEVDLASIETSGSVVMAIWIIPSPTYPDRVTADLFTLGYHRKSLEIQNDRSSWNYRQHGACVFAASCPRAAITREGEEYAIASQEAGSLAALDCVCARAAHSWSNALALILHMLQAPRPIVIKAVSRDQPLPREAFRRHQVEEENRRYPRYVHISLSEPIEISADAPAKSKNAGQAEPLADDAPRHPVAGYWKVLVPGENKPWKALKTVHVESYPRRQRIAVEPTRYIIEP